VVTCYVWHGRIGYGLGFSGFQYSQVSQHKPRSSKAVGSIELDGDGIIPSWKESFLCFWPIQILVIQEKVDQRVLYFERRVYASV
jgi:hypothetical protein